MTRLMEVITLSLWGFGFGGVVYMVIQYVLGR